MTDQECARLMVMGLTTAERKIIVYLLARPGIPVTAREIWERCLGRASYSENRDRTTLATFIRNLRDGGIEVQNLPGKGYYFGKLRAPTATAERCPA